MGFKCGIVGLPNVGKSTLFNALTQTAAAEAANYPFCTIEPNVGDVGVPDARLDSIGARSASRLPRYRRASPSWTLPDLVRGASKGEGLGNQFLAHIREVDAVAYVLRCFEDTDIAHVEGRIDPIADAETVETELDAGRPRQPGAPAGAVGQERRRSATRKPSSRLRSSTRRWSLASRRQGRPICAS